MVCKTRMFLAVLLASTVSGGRDDVRPNVRSTSLSSQWGQILNIMIPAYYYPFDSLASCQDSRYIDLAAAGSIITAIVNPDSGPVSSNASSAQYSVRKLTPNFDEVQFKIAVSLYLGFI